MKSDNLMTVKEVINYFRQHSRIESARQVYRIRQRPDFPKSKSLPGCRPTYDRVEFVAWFKQR